MLVQDFAALYLQALRLVGSAFRAPYTCVRVSYGYAHKKTAKPPPPSSEDFSAEIIR